jgi:hypothetical protein
MNLLTPTGYKNIEDVNIGDELIAYDINTGEVIINTLLKKELWTHDMYPANPPMHESVYNEETQEYEDVLVYEGMSSEDIFQENHGDWKFYEINGTWKLFKNQSIWANMKTVHVTDLQIGDVIYDDDDNDIVITSIVECTQESWWRLEVSNDHSYISENLQLHNASRYWQKQNASFNWNATGPTNWGSASGVSDGASVPTSVDDVFFDGVGANGNINSTISATITILSINISSGYTATLTHNAVLTIAGNVTLSTPYTIAGTSLITISAASTITSNGKTWPNAVTFSGANTKTLNGDFTIGGLLATNSSQITTLNQTGSNTLRCNGVSLGFNGGIIGTATLRLTGGTYASSGGGNSYINTNLIFDGNITLTNQLVFGGASFTKVSGTITGSIPLSLLSTCTLDLAGITWTSILFSAPNTITLNSLLTTSGTANFSSGGGVSTFAGAFGFSVGTLIPPTGGNLSLKNGVTYTINNALSGGVGNSNAIVSDSGTLRANLILVNGATCNTRQAFTRIDATGGRTINSWNGTITDSINVRSFTDLQTVAAAIIT